MPGLYKLQIEAFLIAGICGAMAFPVTTKVIYSSIEQATLAIRLLITSSIGIFLSALWLTIQEKLFKWFAHFALVECFCYLVLIMYVIITSSFDSYLILSAIIAGTIGYIVSGGGNKLHQKITDVEQYRTDYMFFTEICGATGVLIGSLLTIVAPVNLAIGFVLLLISLTWVNLTNIYIFCKIRKKCPASR